MTKKKVEVCNSPILKNEVPDNGARNLLDSVSTHPLGNPKWKVIDVVVANFP